MAIKSNDLEILQSYTLDELIELVKEKAKMDIDDRLSEAKNQLVSLLSGSSEWSESSPKVESAPVKKKGRGRPKGSTKNSAKPKSAAKEGKSKRIPLGQYLEQVLTPEPQKVDDLYEALKSVGYQSNAQDPRRILYLELTRQVKAGKVKKSGRGLYSAKK
ncbi:MAG: hypothetical protein RBU29_05410 [bacterium]|jgi:hypothetical protein|nr:hypothetical protein [bacterium]